MKSNESNDKEKNQGNEKGTKEKRHASSSFMKVVQTIFQVVQFLLILIGLAIVGGGTFLLIKANDYSFIPKPLSIGLIVIGAGIAIFAILGCIVGKTGSKFASIIYILIILLMVAVQAGFFVMIIKSKAQENLGKLWG